MNILTALILSLTMSLGAGVKCNDAEMYFCDGFFGASLIETKIETVVYNSKDESEDREIPYGVPCYYYQGAYENTCANVAGSIVLGYYDKDYNELIAGFTSARVIRDRVVYYPQTQAVQTTTEDLYVRMGTNTSAEGGTSVSGVKNGLASYGKSKGRNISFTHVGGDKNALISSFASSRPVVMFVNRYVTTEIEEVATAGGKDTYNKQYYGGAHVLVAYGYKEIEYYDTSGALIKSMTVLKVATGLGKERSYVFLDDFTQIADGYAVDIY